jgi:HK97 family phage prohead protease
MDKFDFSGWATKANLKCSDGRVIMKDAFKHCDGQKVPLVWNHQHKSQDEVLGHALLENKEEGVYAYCKFNETESGKTAKELVRHGDIVALSIYANKLKQNGCNVLHGDIREVSLVLAGANPGAFIESVMCHSADGEYSISEDEGYIYTGDTITLYHAEDKKESPMAEETKTPAENAEGGEETVEDVLATLNEKQQKVVYALLGRALNSVEHSDADENNTYEGDNAMKTNVFDQGEVKQGLTLTHADQEAILELAKESGVGSLQRAIQMYAEQNSERLQHGLDLGDADTLEELLPDHKLLNPGAPEILREFENSWVMGVINKIHKSPYSRIRTRKADARVADLRAKGFKKGEEKKYNDHIRLLGRKTEPTTIYIKESLNRDDIVDITDFDPVGYTWTMMKDSLYETLALSALVGDGREDGDPDKISETNIRPIWKDEELYTIHHTVDFEAAKAKLQGTETGAHFGENFIKSEAMVEASLYSREKFKGSGAPTLYCDPHFVNVMLLARDLNGRRIYDSKSDLAKALNVSGIVEIEQLADKVRTTGDGKKKKLIGLIVNLSDYQFGSTRGGEVTKFTDFDIDFNKYKYLMEARLSGALTEPFSAIALEEDYVEEAEG